MPRKSKGKKKNARREPPAESKEGGDRDEVEPSGTSQQAQSSFLTREPVSKEPTETAQPEIEEQVEESNISPDPSPESLPSPEPKQGVKSRFAERPGFGRYDEKIPLYANYFQLKLKDIDIYHYDVDIVFLGNRDKDGGKAAKGSRDEPEVQTEPQLKKGKSVLKSDRRTAKEDADRCVSHSEHEQKRAPGKQKCRKLIAKAIESCELAKYNPVYDGQKNMYSSKALPIVPNTFTVTLDEGRRFQDFKVIIRPVMKKTGGNVIDLDPLNEVLTGGRKDLPQEILMALDTVMCHRIPPFLQIQVGRSFFMLSQRPYDAKEGVEIWFGYNQSVRPTMRGPALVVNWAAKAFHKPGPVIKYVSEVLSAGQKSKIDITKPLLPNAINHLSKVLKGIKVGVTHLKYRRVYIIKGVLSKSAKEQKCSFNGRDMTVATYFKETYQKELKYPDLPCLHMRSNTNKTYIPMEVCEIEEHQPILGKLSATTTRSMIKETARNPLERFGAIGRELNNLQTVSGPTMRSFSLGLEYQPMSLVGGVIERPAIRYRDAPITNDFVAPDPCGKWKITKKNFLKTPAGCSWMLVNFSWLLDINCLRKFASVLVRSARNVGMDLKEPKEIITFKRGEKVHQALEFAKRSHVTFAVVVLSDRDDYHKYEEVKFIADIELQLVTQCMKDTVVRTFSVEGKWQNAAQIADNVLLKINAKLGGVTHSLSHQHPFFSRPIIVFGADAIHSPRGYSCPSIAALVGSLDANPSQYAVTCRVQKYTDESKFSQEIILELKEMVKCILRRFLYTTKGKEPEKILFFRDGVSEGQFETVLEEEIPQIREACNEVLQKVKPPITFIVVQKRHQTRLRPRNPRDGVGKMGNVPPGTVVDNHITHPIFYDFFICSHEGIQGTSKPAHYTVLLDENSFSVNSLQKVCYHLCYTYARCNRSISVPPPVMYADLACTRAKQYADLFSKSDAQSSSSGSSGEQRDLPDRVKNAINNLMATFTEGMFYV